MEWFLTWLWQGIALVLLVTCLLRAVPSTNASTRYLVWWATLLAVLVLPWIGSAGRVTGAFQAEAGALAAAGPTTLLPVTLPPAPAWLIAISVGTWLGVAAWRLTNVVRALRHLLQLKGRCVNVPHSRQGRLPLWLSVRDRGRKADLCVSDAVTVASVLGLVRPIIVLPQSLMDALADDELDQIVLHEHAHVQRRDDWARLGQVLIEAICGLHPAVCWIGRALNEERENACDDWVAIGGRGPRAYAWCLAKVANVAAFEAGRSAPAVAPGALRSRHEISRRVGRLLDKKRNASFRPSRAALAVGVSFIVVMVTLSWGLAPIVAVGGPAMTPEGVSTAAEQVVELVPSVGRQVSDSNRGSSAAWSVADSPPVRPGIPSSTSSRTPRAEATGSPDLPPAEQATQPTLIGQVPLGASSWLLIEAAAPRVPVGLTPRRLSAEPAAPASVATDLTVFPSSAPDSTSDLRSNPGIADDQPPWSKAADAGVAIGAGFTKAGRETAGAFLQLGAAFTRAFRRAP